MKKRHILISAGFATMGALAGFGVKALADGIPSPNPLYYSGTLTEGGVLVTGMRALTVNLWPDGTTTGTPLCQTVVSTANVVSGRFRIALASACKTAINQNASAYVEVIDGATSLGRSPIGAVPYAVEADHSVSATNANNAANAAYAADAGHASTADIATNAANASSLAAGVSGGLTAYLVPGNALVPPCAPNAVTGTVDCTCPSGTYVVAGGGYTGRGGANSLRESEPVGTTIWRTTCQSATGDIACVNYYLLCSRLGP